MNITDKQAEQMADFCDRMATVIRATPGEIHRSAMARASKGEPSFLEALLCLTEALAEENEKLRQAMTEEKAATYRASGIWTELVGVPLLIRRLRDQGLDPAELHQRLMPAIPLPLLDLAKALGEVAVDAAWYVHRGEKNTIPKYVREDGNDDLEK